ncbi:cupin domain-containing protein [Pleionea mediterranea]|uniref:Mannose-6-phosphate isomerase-like protein (Cupin superfamily) n=1 Tax=Pleionea mediterranea TaxID=523701 RepID=A0A316FBS7_9GAMM|nr:cupin domain-containing protein [Pleionea mediterranea]PWK44423.1 mannose-6-phosphate isomerase-like protein (cupin superfamily) [Pleionea mediterranea]
MTKVITNKSINLMEKLSLFSEHWSPKVIAEMNDYQFKLVKLKGEFTWHKHEHTDETFLVLKGEMTILLRDKTIKLCENELYVVPKGVEHKPVAEQECQVLIIEPKGVINTGDADSELTADNDVWI